MFAGHIVAPGRIEIVDVPDAEPLRGGGDEILFRPELACLCGSDMPYFDGDAETYPLDPGLSLHEMIGTVVETSGKRFRKGDRVLAVPLEQRGFFERYPVRDARAIPVDPRCSPEQAVLAQPLGTVIHGMKKLPPVLDAVVAVVGQGPIGQLFCAVLRNAGAEQIVAIDPIEERLKTSGVMGATSVVASAAEDPVQGVALLTGSRMADVVIECVGHRAQALNLCGELCRAGGRILYFGVPPETLDGIAWRRIFRKNLTIHTSVDPDFERDFPLAMQWIAEERIDVGPLVTHRFSMAHVQEAYEIFRDRRDGALKVFIELSD